jgi:tetratricopeptide (TPR) repeat protein
MSNNNNEAIDYLIIRDFDKAQALFEKEVETKSSLEIAHAGLAICFSIKGEIEIARKEMVMSFSISNSEPLAYVASAILCDISNDIADAENHFTQALKIDPVNLYALYCLGTFLIKHKKISGGIECLEKAKTIDRRKWTVRQNLAIGYSYNNDYRNALKESFTAFLIMPSIPNFSYVILYFTKVFPYVLWLILGIATYIFILNPRSIVSIITLTSLLAGLNFWKYLVEKKQNELIFSILIIASGILYYFINIK